MSELDTNRQEQQLAYRQAAERWEPILNHEGMPKLDTPQKRVVTAMLLENTEKEAFRANEIQRGGWGLLTEDAPTNVTAGIQNYDPVLISMVRRMAPNLVAYDICGVQPMTGPTGLIFTLRAKYADQGGKEAFYNEPDAAHSAPHGGAGEVAQTQGGDGNPGDSNYNSPQAIATRRAEILGYDTSAGDGATGAAGPFPEMAMTIDEVAVKAKTRALKAEYSIEMAQDLRAIHGMDAATELTNILSTEILGEINREIVRAVNIVAKTGAQEDTSAAGEFDLDVDSNGRWNLERFKGMSFQIQRECNAVAKATRRGKGNIVLCSSDVAAALQEAQNLNFEPRRGMVDDSNMNVDDTGTTYVGRLNGGQRVFIDPYATANYFNVGYRGQNAYDAGLFYCPYVPLQMLKAIGENDFQPRIAFKTRYGVVENTFARGVWAVGDVVPDGATVTTFGANGNAVYHTATADVTLAAAGAAGSGLPAHNLIIGRPKLIAEDAGVYDFGSTKWAAANNNVYYRLVIVDNLT